MKQQLTHPSDAARKLGLICVGLSLVVFTISLATPALGFRNTHTESQSWTSGLWAFVLLGPLALIDGQFGWLANIALAFGWVAAGFNRQIIAGICGAFAFLLSLHTLQLLGVPLQGEAHAAPQVLNQLGTGFYLWTLSMLLVVLGAVVSGRKKPKHGSHPTESMDDE